MSDIYRWVVLGLRVTARKTWFSDASATKKSYKTNKALQTRQTWSPLTAKVCSTTHILLKACLNGFNVCFNMSSTKLLIQMSGAFEQVIQHCCKRKKCWKLVESNLNWFQITFNIDSTYSLFLKMLNGVETVCTLCPSNICPTSVHQCWANVETVSTGLYSATKTFSV